MREKLIIGRLFVAKDGGVTEATLRKDLLPLFTKVMDLSAAEQALRSVLEEALGAGQISRSRKGKSVNYTLSAEGRTLAHRFFPNTPKATWTSLKKTWLAAHALGVDKELAPAEVKELSKATVLRMVLINQHFDLGLPTIPKTKAFETALLWYGARRGLSEEVYDWVKHRNPTVGLILVALTASAGHVPPSTKKAAVLSHLAGKIAGGSDLHLALLTRLVGAAANQNSPGSPETADSAASEQESSERVAPDFASRVLHAARSSTTGRLGDDLVLISHAFRQFATIYPGELPSLETFKEQLMSAALSGQLHLASADMPQTLNADDYRASRIDRGASIYALIRI